MKALEYVLLDPTGNVTVLVRTAVPVPAQPRVARALLEAEPRGEQVGFLSPGGADADIALRMAGGEFCGNAAMCAAALWCIERGLSAQTVRVRVSGADRPVAVQAAAQAEDCWSCAEALPRPAPPEMVTLALDGQTYRLPLLRFPGIGHLILPGDTDRAFAERAARSWCAALGAEALGLMLLDEAAGRMTPLVYVPGADTLYWERSCASGTAAAGAYLAWKRGASVEAALDQPGGFLRVFAAPAGEIRLRGAVRVLKEGKILA